MLTSLVLTVIGPDKPGLVGLLSHTIANHHGNWLESGMSRLGGKFAGILITQVPETEVEALTQALQGLAQQGLKVTVEHSEEPPPAAAMQPMVLELVGHDKPGIVREISHALAARHINVERLSTELTSGSMSAEELFKAEAELLAPADLDPDELQQALEAIAGDLMVDITLR
ncbi:glycine cleavage system protein R [Marinobacterium weihaiense]|uniref:Glycine cleavage system transcriptional repressor n=1 Tax=Marinobacterium weihaiense TaxID=2851016 RepID=A0ABS6MCE7_9GAMM|nr:ACT domain-containing protein [Marinobacterium weihaiense]MBV0933981.1 glycine cleavage system protein R [Marinobacterium weihaiense]